MHFLLSRRRNSARTRSHEREKIFNQLKIPSASIHPTSMCSEALSKARGRTADTNIWDSLVAKLSAQPRIMPMDECHTRALELQTIARSEVDCRIPHASDSMPITAIGQPALKITAHPWTPVAFVPISPMKYPQEGVPL